MDVRNGIFWITALTGVFALSSCSSTRKSAANRSASSGKGQVEFLDDITLNRSNNGSARVSRKSNAGSMASSAGSAELENAQAWQFKYAQLLDVAVEEVRNARLYHFIEDWWGTPYRYGGKSKQGIDCSAFVNTLMSAVFRQNLMGSSYQMYEHVKKLRSRNELREGDLVFFSIGRKRVSHVGVYLENDRFVHASTSSGVMISDLNETYWRRYYTGAGRVE
ncbi:C40 family peptidase [Chitinophaga japonensis]|uniref:Lipoprotein Spr n=1 Tax=Chitinophaga japonensis TaxID=104662 RepID=A0A562T015_CHIJA|nr:C40 family peptidase [Chitinophaga japonensis]TWI86885.1 lipoprotein Spr [Chitinophaga japonensis]